MDRFQEYSMGWGLRTAEPVSRGSLVIEYIGEVVDESQMQVHRAPSFSHNHTLLHIELPPSLTTAHYCISKSLLLSHPHVIAHYSLLSDYHHVTLPKLNLIFSHGSYFYSCLSASLSLHLSLCPTICFRLAWVTKGNSHPTIIIFTSCSWILASMSMASTKVVEWNYMMGWDGVGWDT